MPALPVLLPAQPPEGQPLPLRGLTLLAVEDSRYTSDLLRLMCQRSGARFRRAETIETALAHLRLYRPDFALIDLGLPDGRGEDLIKALAKAEGAGRVIVLGFSGDPSGRRSALAAGAAGFLEKPLPDLQGFQAVLLSHLADCHLRAAPFSASLSPDHLALVDDLRRAEAVLRHPEKAGMQEWLQGFLAGIALQADDPALADLAHSVRETGVRQGALADLLSARIALKAAFPRRD